MKNILLALGLCAFIAAPALAEDHTPADASGHAAEHSATGSEEVSTTTVKKKMAKTRHAPKGKAMAKKKVTTETTEEAPAEEAPAAN